MAYTFRQLNYAVTVAKCGNNTGAAKEVETSQPSISAALKNLEIEFGISIFMRQPAHRIKLMPAGKHFIRHVRR